MGLDFSDNPLLTEPRVHMTSPTDNLFNETAKNNAKVKFGAPHIVDLGQELQYSPDGKVGRRLLVDKNADVPSLTVESSFSAFLCRFI